MVYVVVGSPFIFGIFDSKIEAERLKDKLERERASAHLHILSIPMNFQVREPI